MWRWLLRCFLHRIYTQITAHTFNYHSSHTCTYINKSKISQTQHIWLSMIIKMFNILLRNMKHWKWFIDYLNIANGFKLFVCCCWHLVSHLSVDLLPFKIKNFDRLTFISTVMLYIFNWCKYKLFMTSVIYTHQVYSKFITWHYFSLYLHCSRYIFLRLSLYGEGAYWKVI